MVPLCGHRAAAQSSRPSQEQGELMFGRECNHSLRVLLSFARFPSTMMQNDDPKLDKTQTKRMGEFLCQPDRFIDPLESLVRVAEGPQGEGKAPQGHHLAINADGAEGERTMALTIIKGDRHFEMLPGKKQLPLLISSKSQMVVSEHQ